MSSGCFIQTVTLHIRQITRLKYDYLKEISNENLRYAGNW